MICSVTVVFVTKFQMTCVVMTFLVKRECFFLVTFICANDSLFGCVTVLRVITVMWCVLLMDISAEALFT